MLKHLLAAALILACLGTAATSQSNDATAEQTDDATDDVLLTQAELENLVAPVALYPDTLLIQILVASTSPMEVIKSDRLLKVNEGEDPEVIKATIEAEEYDESVEVLAVAFPEVIEDMALHIEWTETMGNAMLAQSDDVLTAVQTMRTQAVNSGALVSGDEVSVEVTEEEEVIIQPTDPEVVYVPQYDPQVVYVQDNNTVADAVAVGVITFATFTVLDAVFDDDDDWDDYWRCRNCAGWGGGPIIRNPDIDIDVDGNVNIGNRINIGDGDVDLGDRDVNLRDRDRDIGWKPDDRKRNEAREKISDRRDAQGKTKLPVKKNESRGDELRGKLSGATGAPDISRPGSGAKAEAVRKTMADRDGGGLKRDGGGINRDAVKVNRPQPSKASKPKAKLPAKKPAVKKPAAGKAPIKKAQKAVGAKKPKAIKKKAGGPKARKASNRGKKAGGKLKRR